MVLTLVRGALGDGGLGAGPGRSLPELARATCRELADALRAEGAVLWLHDSEAEGFVAAAEVGVEMPGLLGSTVEGAAAARLTEIAAANRPVVVDSAFAEQVSPRLAQAFGSAAVVVVPIGDEKLAGVVLAASATRTADDRALESAERIALDAARPLARAARGLDHSYLLSTALGRSREAVALVEGPDRVLSYVNLKFRQIFGLTCSPLLGRPLADALTRDRSERFSKLIDLALASAEPQEFSGLDLRDSAGSRLYDMEVVPRPSREGEEPAAVILLRPTAQPTATQALEPAVVKLAESQGILTAVLDSTNNGIFLIGPDLTVLYANRRVAELFNLDLAEIMGRNQQEILSNTVAWHAARPEEFVDRLTFLYQHFEETAVDEVELAHPSHRVLERYSGPVYQEDGSLLGRIEVYADVTEVRELQRNKDDFLSLVSHELRTPVTSIKGYAQLLKRRAGRDKLPEQALLAAETIERQTGRMQELIDLLLDLTRLDTGRLRLEKTEVDLVELTRRVADLVQITAESHRITVTAPSTPIQVHVDEHRLEQVVTNLLQNAVRYSPNGGAIEVTVGHEGDTALLTVRDYGIGIARDALDRIFERFYQAPDVAQSTGLGIGLYISRAVVEEHGGTIGVESELGRGSTFVVTLPV